MARTRKPLPPRIHRMRVHEIRDAEWEGECPKCHYWQNLDRFTVLDGGVLYPEFVCRAMVDGRLCDFSGAVAMVQIPGDA